jgi:hypothetical protein
MPLSHDSLMLQSAFSLVLEGSAGTVHGMGSSDLQPTETKGSTLLSPIELEVHPPKITISAETDEQPTGISNGEVTTTTSMDSINSSKVRRSASDSNILFNQAARQGLAERSLARSYAALKGTKTHQCAVASFSTSPSNSIDPQWNSNITYTMNSAEECPYYDTDLSQLRYHSQLGHRNGACPPHTSNRTLEVSKTF